MENNNHVKENCTIYGAEESLLEELRHTYPIEEKDSLVDDGLCWAAISNELPDTNKRYWPECLWTDSKRRVLFSSKSPMAMAVRTTKIGIGQRVQGHLEMFWHIGLKAL